jgi:preprotein translocase subunit SecB
MTDTPPTGANGGGGDGEQEGVAAEQAGPRLAILTQYVKDLSFENPKAPYGLQPDQARPEIQINVDVQVGQLAADQYEVSLELNVEARAGTEPVFLIELNYGGVFGLANIQPEHVQPLLMIECPRLLFPFARRVVADCTRDGGFPPLMIDPIDFVALFRRRVAQQQQGQSGQA